MASEIHAEYIRRGFSEHWLKSSMISRTATKEALRPLAYDPSCVVTCPQCRKLYIDQPRRKHPELALRVDNLQVLCEDCNMGKGGWDDTDWRAPA